MMVLLLCSSSMSQALGVVAFWFLCLTVVEGWLWLEFQHIDCIERLVKQTDAKKETKTQCSTKQTHLAQAKNQ
jgi:hypothetical protein